MLRSKFWLGPKNQQLRNATRHKYDTVKDFQLLLREIRQVEQEELNLVKPPQGQGQSQKKSVQQRNISASSESKFNNEELYNQLLELKSHIKSLERKIESSEQSSHSHSDQFQYPHPSQSTYPRGRGRGGYRRPFGRGDRNFRGSQGNFGGRNEPQGDQNTSGTTSQDHPRGMGANTQSGRGRGNPKV